MSIDYKEVFRMKTLGIDLGTTKVAVVVYDGRGGLEKAVNSAHHAAVPHGLSARRNKKVCRVGILPRVQS